MMLKEKSKKRATDAKTTRKQDEIKKIEHIMKRNRNRAFLIAMFFYFGAIFVVFFGCFLLPSILYALSGQRPIVVPNPDTITSLDYLFLSPVYPLAKAIIAFLIVLLPAKYYGKGYVFSLLIVALTAIVAWHYILVSWGIERLMVNVKNFNPWIVPLGLLDGLVVMVTALTIGMLMIDVLQNTEVQIPNKTVLKFASIPVALSLVLSAVQWSYIF
ncbi:MAG: hypothetical protein QXY94_06045 [Archaeoglobaceae archaeon]